MTLSNRIQEVRKATQLNKVQFGKLVGVSHSAVGQWESGETKSLKYAKLMKIEKETGFSANWIDTGKGSKMISESDDPQRDRVQKKLAALSIDKKQQLNEMSIDEISIKIRGLKQEQQAVMQALLDSWEHEASRND